MLHPGVFEPGSSSLQVLADDLDLGLSPPSSLQHPLSPRHGAPHPKQSWSSLLGHQRLSQLCSLRETNTPLQSLCPGIPRGCDPAARWPAHGAELCLGHTATRLCPKHLRLSSHSGSHWGPGEGREQDTATQGPCQQFLQPPPLASSYTGKK